MDAQAHIPFRFYSLLGWIIFTTSASLAIFANALKYAP